MKLTARQLTLRKKYTSLRKFGRSDHSAFLQIDHQGFEVVNETTRKRANWFRDMLAVALDRLIQNEGGKK